MDNSRPITRSVSSQLGHRDTSVDSPKVESGGESHERQPPAAEGVAVMAAIQSLGEALEGYSARVSSMEEQFRLLSPSVQGVGRSVGGGAAYHVWPFTGLPFYAQSSGSPARETG